MGKSGASLWGKLTAAGNLSQRFISSREQSFVLRELLHGSNLGSSLQHFYGRAIFIRTKYQLATALTLLELDGIARRLVLCPPDLPHEHLALAISLTEADVVVCDNDLGGTWANETHVVRWSSKSVAAQVEHDGGLETEWILFTSGTTGVPKLVVHTLTTLCPTTGAIGNVRRPVVWSTFYDIRRYGGLQVFLRAILSGGSLALSSAEESTENFLNRAGANGVSHISGTPSHWRRALMSPVVQQLAPAYIRLSGEVVDQAILDHLHAAFPEAKIVHAFASTEAGLAFEVQDSLAGFPASLIGSPSHIQMKIENGSLRIRSPHTAVRYLGSSSEAIADADGFVDTRDLIELRGDRYYFRGRADGVINVGGLKVHPEEVEAVINRHPEVRMSVVKGRRNPITGELVVADVVVRSPPGHAEEAAEAAELRSQILEICRRALAPHKVPAAIRLVPGLAMTASGKLAR
jgi:acyl-coenzyme A synthetase/AMP-(fatty) acid ligase